MQNQIKKSLQKVELSNKPTVFITEKLKKQIAYLHSKCGSNEWSGELITSEVNTINDLDDWTIIAEDMFLTDIGTSAFTGYEVDKGGFKAADIIELYESYPDLLEGKKKNHHIHTHHNMDTFFSGTDWSQLEDRGCLSNYLLMLIVNNKGKAVAKVAFKAKQRGPSGVNLEFINNADNFEPIKLKGDSDQDVLVVMDCKIKWEVPDNEVDTSFEQRYAHIVKTIEEEKEKEKKTYQPYIYGGSRSWEQGLTNPFPKRSWEQGELGLDIDPFPKSKHHNSIMSMTEKEWEKSNRSSSVFMGRKEGFLLINQILDSKDFDNSTTPISALIKLGNTLKTKAKMEQWLHDFSYIFHEKFESNFIEGIDEDVEDILMDLCEYFFPFKNNDFIRLFHNKLEQMLEWITPVN